MYYYIFMTALVAFGHLPEKGFPLNDFRRADFTSRPQSFGHEANALPKLCKCYAYSTIKAPDKGEVGGSSPPRPTIQFNDLTIGLDSSAGRWFTFWFTPLSTIASIAVRLASMRM